MDHLKVTGDVLCISYGNENLFQKVAFTPAYTIRPRNGPQMCAESNPPVAS